MPHFTGKQLCRCLLVVLAFASSLLAQAVEGQLARVIDLNPRHNEAASPSLTEPKTLIVPAKAEPLLAATIPPTEPPTKPTRDSQNGLTPARPQPAVRDASSFDPTAETHPPQATGGINVRQVAALNAPRLSGFAVLKLVEEIEVLPERVAPRETVVHNPAPASTAKRVIQLANAEPLLAVLQSSPSASDLPAPAAQSPLTEEQNAVAKEIEAFELDVKPIGELSVCIKPEGDALPRNYASVRFAREGEVAHRMGFSRSMMETTMMWEAPAICHRPLYFEEINLERHGYKIPLVQPVISAAHFFGRVPLLPYMMVSEGHRDCQYTLGHYQPGDYAPYSLYIPRLRLDASAAEAAVAAGLILAIP